MNTASKPAAVKFAAVSGALIVLGTAAHFTGAQAQEFCVACQGPEASYRCLIGGEGTPAARSSRGQFLCITELAKAGGHATRSVSRSQATPCPGETRSVLFSLADPETSPLGQARTDGATAPAMGLSGSPQIPPAAVGSTVPHAAPGGGMPPMTPVGTIDGGAYPPGHGQPAGEEGYPTPLPPETAAEAERAAAAKPQKPGALQDMANKTGKAFNDTGKAVGKAVKKSWDCVTSLFGDC
ncbi:hypothetical protein [Hyphomicrobium sp. D-2]|uniref:hypothetical protein n=1 Tax=Hyphomicrobium sp. D-2 TaxID=3041621 RepID=UPI0024575060|nr:hypothetical protein [Hyphomicrobium sp. D-2]MDH4982791.1 hypothetical protein [Hyphomicrobium sp. D-2]